MALKILTDDKGIKVFRKDTVSKNGNQFTRYFIKVSSKKQDDSWADMFMDVVFRKGVSVDNKAVISIKNAFPIVDDYNEQNKKMKLMIMEFDVISSGEGGAQIITDVDGFMEIPDNLEEEMPFA